MIRRMLLGILIFGQVGTVAELLLLGHDEGILQFIPLVLIGIGLVLVSWHAKTRTSSSLMMMRSIMVAFVASGLLGIALHYRGSMEFHKEVDPSMHGFELFMKVMQSKAPPALAPAVMVYLGLLGLVCTYNDKDRSEKI